MKSSRFILSFAAQLFVVLLFALAIHYLAFDLRGINISRNAWTFTYLTNFLMTASAILLIYKFRITHTSSLGYIFLATSLAKLLLFPLIIQPILFEYCQNETHAFLLFFIPYFIALMVEVLVLVRLLNRL